MNRTVLIQSGWPGIGLARAGFFLFIYLLFQSQMKAQDHTLDVGLRFQKTVNLYYENGFTLQYNHQKFLSPNVYFGFSYVTSRLGSAMGTNALKQDNYLISSSYYFRREKVIRPFLRINAGYFYADYEEEIFSDLPNSSALLSSEAGVAVWTRSPIKIGASLGYNLITGNGIKGPGTLYPLFFQTSITWNILNLQKNENL